jgi:hypothetical protein
MDHTGGASHDPPCSSSNPWGGLRFDGHGAKGGSGGFSGGIGGWAGGASLVKDGFALMVATVPNNRG